MCTVLYLILYAVVYVTSEITGDGRLNFVQIAAKYGLKCEVYDVMTKDYYILKLFRIRGDETKPILLSHGLFDSADTFIMRGDSSLAYALAKKGYDVWALNVRGTRYGRRHLIFNPDKDKAFWNYSFHEMGIHDLPANIDFILKRTNQPKLTLIGHSQGAQISFVLTSLKTEYNSKIKLIIALAPALSTNDYLHLFPLSMSATTWLQQNLRLQSMNQEELFNEDSLQVKNIRAVCTLKDIGYTLCGHLSIFRIAGSDPEQLEPEFFPVLFGHYPISTSRKNVDHHMHLALKKKFVQYDYGIGNLAAYGSLEPLEYPLNRITAPVALLVGHNDKLVDETAVYYESHRFPNAYYHVMENKKINHMDFVWGKYMKRDLFPVLFALLKKYTTSGWW